MSWDRITDALWRVYMYLAKRHTLDRAEAMSSPLSWYIRTGRASAGFLKAFCDTKPFVIGRILEKGGSYDDVIKALKKKMEVE